jgi:CRISPR-associated protein Cmr1
MMRPDPGNPPQLPATSPPLPAGTARQVRRYELITPLFGGGVLPRQADPITVVRGSEIRGHLRFWWRACRGGAFDGNLLPLKAAEDALWGAAGGAAGPLPSQVKLAVTVHAQGRPFQPKDWHGNSVAISNYRSPYSYVAFPLQQYPDAVTVEGVIFDLEITYPAAQRAEIDAALWAWQTFGGIGGRTRRGFGALCCTHVDGVPTPPIAAADLHAHLQRMLQTVSAGPWPAGLPYLSASTPFRLAAHASDSLAAWQHLIRKLKEFRQNRPARTAAGRPGRSYWPEPDEIRRRFGGQAFAHVPLNTVGKFPRAAFGLPILFHFMGNNEPPETRLQSAGYGRLASPLILRPICCREGAVGLGLILQGALFPPGPLELHGAPPGAPIITRLDPADTSTIPALKGQTNVLLAFLDSL